MINETALHTIVFDEADNASRLPYKNQNGKNISCAIFDDFDCLVDMIYLHLTVKKNLSNSLRDHNLANAMTENEVSIVNRVLATNLEYR